MVDGKIKGGLLFLPLLESGFFSCVAITFIIASRFVFLFHSAISPTIGRVIVVAVGITFGVVTRVEHQGGRRFVASSSPVGVVG